MQILIFQVEVFRPEERLGLLVLVEFDRDQGQGLLEQEAGANILVESQGDRT